MTSKNYLKNKRVFSMLVACTAVLTLSLTLGPGFYANAEQLISPISQDDNSAVGQAPDSANSGYTTKKTTAQIPVTPTLSPSLTVKNASFVQAGIGLRNVGSGTISVHVPTGASMVNAILYYTIIDTGTPTAPTTSSDNTIFFNGEKITGKLIGSDASPCWGGNIYVYKADVTSNLVRRGGPIGDQYISTNSRIVNAVSPWTSAATPQAESAHLVIIYRESTPIQANVNIYDAAGTPGTLSIIGGPASFTAAFGHPHIGGAPATIGYGLADGQFFGVPEPSGKSFSWDSTALATGGIYGRDPSLTSLSSVRGTLSDTTQFDVTGLTAGGTTSGTFDWNFAGDCLTTVYVAVQA